MNEENYIYFFKGKTAIYKSIIIQYILPSSITEIQIQTKHTALDVSIINTMEAVIVKRVAEETGYALTLRNNQKWGEFGDWCLREEYKVLLFGSGVHWVLVPRGRTIA